MTRKEKKQGQQNKGFTLLEVLIAMTILSIIVVPLLRAFVTSAGVNAKARREMNATSVAENVIEELKSSSFDAVMKEFETAGADASWGGKVDSATQTTVEKNGVDVTSYNFFTTDIPMNNTTYDAAVHLTANANGTKNLANVNSMDDAGCGYYVEDEDLALTAAEAFQMRNAAYVYKKPTVAKVDVERLMAEMSRKITITVNAASVDVTYTYTVSSDYTDAGQNTYTETVRIFENTFSGEELKAVYLYFNPLHKKTDVATKTDTITIHNTNGTKKDLDVFLIRMEDENPFRPDDFASATNIETANSGNPGGKKLQICTNIATPLVVGDGGDIKTLSNAAETVSLYDVEVEVFSHADSNPFAANNLIDTYTGSFLDKTE